MYMTSQKIKECKVVYKPFRADVFDQKSLEYLVFNSNSGPLVWKVSEFDLMIVSRVKVALN
jgi:hypothetical protein